jgi:Mrp family chromosome partitioning ATPase
VVADAPLLASKADGVLLIIRLGHTRKPALSSLMNQIKRSGTRVIGVALNRIPARSIGYYTGNPYYAAYYSDDATQGDGTGQRLARKPLFNFWPFNSRAGSKNQASSERVFDEIDIIEGEGEGYSWRD